MENSTQNSAFIVTVMSTKGGVTKSTNVASIGAFCVDRALRTLMIDTDVQPTLSTYHTLDYTAPQGLFEFLIQSNTNLEQVISKTEYPNLDIIQSNDPTDAITTHLRNSPDGMLRFNDLVRSFNNYDLITVDMSVSASDLVISPLKPELLSAREFVRGTMGLYQQLQVFTKHGFKLPQLKAVINCLDKTNDAKSVLDSLNKWDELSPIVTADNFYLGHHRLIFTVNSELLMADSLADMVTVEHALKQ